MRLPQAAEIIALSGERRITQPAGIWHVEGLVGLEHVACRGAWIVVGSLPIVGGSGAPARVFAIVPSWYICTTMVWAYLTAAIATEVAGTVALKFTDGFARPVPSAIVVLGYGLSFVFLALTLRGLSLSLTYAIWAGIGTAAIAAIGMVALGEPVNAMRISSIGLIVVGEIGLNLAGGH